MKRTILTLIVSLFLCMSAVLPAAATGNSDYSRLVDDAALLEDYQAETVSSMLDETSENRNCDVIIVTVDSLGDKTAQEFADDYYDSGGYGMGDDKSGIMLLLAMEDRDWAISTTGYGITAFTDAGQGYLMDKVMPSLGDGDYYTAFYDFAYYCEELLQMAENGTPYDVKDSEGKSANPIVLIPVEVVPGALISLFLKKKKKKSLKNVKFKKDATDYTAPGSLDISYRADNFLSRTVDRQAKPKDSGGSGGSSTHVSSSGTTHGGSSGKF